MPETDLLNELLSANPNLPAVKGELLLLRVEIKSEFKVVRTELDQKFGKLDQKFAQNDDTLKDLKRIMNGMAQQIAVLVERSVK